MLAEEPAVLAGGSQMIDRSPVSVAVQHLQKLRAHAMDHADHFHHLPGHRGQRTALRPAFTRAEQAHELAFQAPIVVDVKRVIYQNDGVR